MIKDIEHNHFAIVNSLMVLGQSKFKFNSRKIQANAKIRKKLNILQINVNFMNFELSINQTPPPNYNHIHKQLSEVDTQTSSISPKCQSDSSENIGMQTSEFNQQAHWMQNKEIGTNLVSLKSQEDVNNIGMYNLIRIKSCSAIQMQTVGNQQIVNHTQLKQTSPILNQYQMNKHTHHQHPTPIDLNPPNQQSTITPNTSHSLSETQSTSSSSSNSPPVSPTTAASSQNITNELSTSAKEPITKIQPMHNYYYKNRAHFLCWLKKQCIKLHLSRQTYANSVFMLDYFYKFNNCNTNDFLRVALCMMIIASKMNESKILYTPRIAKNNKIDVERMVETEMQLLVWFKFNVNPYNFAKFVMEYMRVWDEHVKERGDGQDGVMFLQENHNSYLLFQEVFYLCEQHLKKYKQLMKTTLQMIFRHVLISNFPNLAQTTIDLIFSQRYFSNHFIKEQYQYAYEFVSVHDEEYMTHRDQQQRSLIQWSQQFIKTKDSLSFRFLNFKNGFRSYGEFINIQI